MGIKLKGIVVIGACVLGGYYIYCGGRSSTQKIYPAHCKYTFDSMFSAEFKKTVKAFIDQAYVQEQKPDALVNAVVKQFPALQQVSFDVHEQEYIKFTLLGYKPLLVINNEYVVVIDGTAFPIAWYHQKSVHELASLKYEPAIKHNKVDKRLVKFFIACPQEIIQDFHIMWKSHEEIELRSKHDEFLVVRTNAFEIPEIQDMTICKNMKEKMGVQRGNKKGRIRTMVCDIRFSRQIVVSSV